MEPIDGPEMWDRVLPCLDRRAAAGRLASTRGRRRAMAKFFHFCAAFDGRPLPWELAADQLLVAFEQVADAIDRFCSTPGVAGEEAREVAADLHAVWQILEPAVGAAFAGWRADGTTDVAGRALAAVFDWDRPGHLRAFVYAETGELMKRGLLDKERSEFLDALDECLNGGG